MNHNLQCSDQKVKEKIKGNHSMIFLHTKIDIYKIVMIQS